MVPQRLTECLDDHPRGRGLRAQRARDDGVLANVQQDADPARKRRIVSARRDAGFGVGLDLGEAGGAQVQVRREQLVGLRRKLLDAPEGVQPLPEEPVRLVIAP